METQRSYTKTTEKEFSDILSELEDLKSDFGNSKMQSTYLDIMYAHLQHRLWTLAEMKSLEFNLQEH